MFERYQSTILRILDVSFTFVSIKLVISTAVDSEKSFFGQRLLAVTTYSKPSSSDNDTVLEALTRESFGFCVVVNAIYSFHRWGR